MVTITRKDVTRRGNVVGVTAAGHDVVVAPRARVAGKPTPYMVEVIRTDGATTIQLEQRTYATIEEACAAASLLVVRTGASWARK